MFSYRPNYPVDLLTQTLAFVSSKKCDEWMAPFNLTFTDLSKTCIDCKNSVAAIPNLV